MGFGTGLNAFLTMLEAEKTGKKIHYYTVELYPISEEQAKTLNFVQILSPEKNEDFLKLHTSKWGEISKISTNFEMLKIVPKRISIRIVKCVCATSSTPSGRLKYNPV